MPWAQVRDVAFRGRGYDLAVDLPGRGPREQRGGGDRVARAETVGLHFDKAGCVVFESNGLYDACSGDGRVEVAEAQRRQPKNEPTPASSGGRTMP